MSCPLVLGIRKFWKGWNSSDCSPKMARRVSRIWSSTRVREASRYGSPSRRSSSTCTTRFFNHSMERENRSSGGSSFSPERPSGFFLPISLVRSGASYTWPLQKNGGSMRTIIAQRWKQMSTRKSRRRLYFWQGETVAGDGNFAQPLLDLAKEDEHSRFPWIFEKPAQESNIPGAIIFQQEFSRARPCLLFH